MAYADAPAGIDPNTEHPPLGKVLIALSMQLFGDNGFGWRIPSLIAGMITLLALYGDRPRGRRAQVAGRARGERSSRSTTSRMVHSRIGVLDMLALAPILVGAWLALRRRYAFAGVAFAIGALVKVTAGFGFLAFLIWEGLILYRRHRAGEPIALPNLRPILIATGTYVTVGLVGLAAARPALHELQEPHRPHPPDLRLRRQPARRARSRRNREQSLGLAREWRALRLPAGRRPGAGERPGRPGVPDGPVPGRAQPGPAGGAAAGRAVRRSGSPLAAVIGLRCGA